MKKYVDPNFTYHLAVAQTVGEIGRKLADSQILPFDFRQYAKDLIKKKEDLVNDFGESMTSHGIKLGKLDLSLACSVKVLHLFGLVRFYTWMQLLRTFPRNPKLDRVANSPFQFLNWHETARFERKFIKLQVYL